MDDISCKDGICTLLIRNRKRDVVAITTFNERHLSKVAPLKWNLHYNNRCPRNHKTRKYLHQIVMGRKKGCEIDHINGDRLDNRDDNLRFVTRHQNMWNLPVSKRNKSGCRGVWWDSKNQAWQVKICHYRKQIFLGRYKSLDEAISVRRAAEEKYYGKYTRAV